MDATADIGNTQADKLRRTIRTAGHVHDAGEGLRNKVIADLVREWPRAPKGGNRDHYHLGIDFLERRIVKATFFHHARPEILNHNIYGRNQCPQDFKRLRFVEIQTEAFFAAILLDKIGAALIPNKRQQTRRITHGGLFHFDNIGAHLCHEAGDSWPGQVLGEIQNRHAGKHIRLFMCPLRLLHTAPPLNLCQYGGQCNAGTLKKRAFSRRSQHVLTRGAGLPRKGSRRGRLRKNLRGIFF